MLREKMGDVAHESMDSGQMYAQGEMSNGPMEAWPVVKRKGMHAW